MPKYQVEFTERQYRAVMWLLDYVLSYSHIRGTNDFMHFAELEYNDIAKDIMINALEVLRKSQRKERKYANK